MTPLQLSKYLIFAINNNFPVLIKGKPGIGKTDIVKQAAKLAGAKLMIAHPVVSDPTDFKGLPARSEDGTEAIFLPFHELNILMNAKEPIVYFLDDLGQAPASVQAAVMQFILSRSLNGFQISKFVTFLAATNRKEDKAGVTGILEPVKSRFASIVELETTVDDWCKWALSSEGNMPTELISFVRFKPELLEKFVPSSDLVNSPTPRTISNIGRQQNAGLDPALYAEVFKGAAGEGFGTEYAGFLQLYKDLPSFEKIVLNPDTAELPKAPGTQYAISGMLAGRMTDQNIDPICKYLKRLPAEISVACIKDAQNRKPELSNTRAFIQWASDNAQFLV